MIDRPTHHISDEASRDGSDGRSAKPLVVGMVILTVAVIVYFGTGMPGMDRSTSTAEHDMSLHPAHLVVDEDAFEAAIADPDTVTINVHVPAADIQLDGMDLVMPFDNIDVEQLPSDRDRPLAV